MRPIPRKKLDAYIRLLRLFETHLKEYHKVFDNDYYKINYIIQREQFTNDVHIKIILTILRQSFWMLLSNESNNLKRILENYSRYFCVTDVTIVRPFNMKRREKLKESPYTPDQPITERVSFDLLMYETRWTEIHRDYI